MATGLAHELNQPLAATVYFLGAADTILADPANFERGQAFVKMASEQALRAGAIIRRMREFMTKSEVDAQAVDIAGIIQDAVALSFLGGAQSDIRLRYELDPAVATVLADPVQIQQVFANLFRNAAEELRKYPPDQREITIRTAQVDGDMVECSVSDTGRGLNPRTLALLYKPFVSTKGEKSMGVGLSICRRIVEAHRGTFHAGNNPGGGAIFRFTLPRMETPKGDPSS
jgi:two-component system sensor kinase FixL